MLPLVGGLLLAGPLSGMLSDRFGARPFATLGAVLAGVVLRAARTAAGRLPLPGVRRAAGAQRRSASGSSSRPTARRVMNSLPPWRRGVGAGMTSTCRVRRPGALDRRLLLADDHRALIAACRRPSTTGSSPTASPTPSRRTSRTCRRSVDLRDVPRLQPGRPPARPRDARRTCRPAQAAILDRPRLLPAPDHQAVLERADGGVHLRHHHLRARRRCVGAARRALRMERGRRPGRRVAPRRHGNAGVRAVVARRVRGRARRRRSPRPARCGLTAAGPRADTPGQDSHSQWAWSAWPSSSTHPREAA